MNDRMNVRMSLGAARKQTDPLCALGRACYWDGGGLKPVPSTAEAAAATAAAAAAGGGGEQGTIGFDNR